MHQHLLVYLLIKLTGTIQSSTFSAVTDQRLVECLHQNSRCVTPIDGSALTGITGSGSGVVVQHDGSNVGTEVQQFFKLRCHCHSRGIKCHHRWWWCCINKAFINAQNLNVTGFSTFLVYHLSCGLKLLVIRIK